MITCLFVYLLMCVSVNVLSDVVFVCVVSSFVCLFVCAFVCLCDCDGDGNGNGHGDVSQ